MLNYRYKKQKNELLGHPVYCIHFVNVYFMCYNAIQLSVLHLFQIQAVEQFCLGKLKDKKCNKSLNNHRNLQSCFTFVWRLSHSPMLWKKQCLCPFVCFPANHLTDKDAKAFADALKENRTLTHLDLSYNQIGEMGGIYLGAGVVSNVWLYPQNKCFSI